MELPAPAILDVVPPPRPPLFAPPPGGWLRRLGFRFLSLYLIIFLLGRVLGLVPGLGWFAGQLYQFWRNVTPWFGREVLHLSERVALAPSGSGDKLWDWVQISAMLAFAALGSLVWVWFDRARRWDGWIDELTRITVRYTLGMTMLSYGLSKVLHQQMPGPTFYRLLETYGESSPMGLLWTFMGLSPAYSAFAGGLEFIGGWLLLFRRTTLLGALLLVIVMTNVLLMNLCFDVPVKLYSAHYLLMALVLVAPDSRRLRDLFVADRAIEAPPASRLSRPWPTGRAGRLFTVVKVLIVAQILWQIPVQRLWFAPDNPTPPKSELYGLYEVESFTRNSEVLPPLLTDVRRWRRVAIDERNNLTVLFMTERRGGYRVRPGPRPATLTLESFAQRNAPRDVVSYRRPSPNELVLEGKVGGDELVIKLRRADESKLRLINRGFHWISEQPFNR